MNSQLAGALSASPHPPRGRHKVYLGMAAGVGKTYRALQDLRDQIQAGRDGLIGVLETHGRRETQQAAEGLPTFPRQSITYKGVTVGELDTAGLLERHPQVVLIDDLAHANALGSRFEKRYQDVEQLLAAGIDVISTLNIQHLESLNDTVARLTGVRVRERLPDFVVQGADEVILVDVSPEVLQERLRGGKIYAPDKVEQALGHFFTSENLSALRELALRQLAEAVQPEPEGEQKMVRDRILVACAPEPESGRLIRRGGRVAARLSGDLIVAYVSTGRLSREQTKILDSLRAAAESLEGEFVTLPNRGGVGRSLVDYIREHGITQVVLGETSRSRWTELFKGSVIHQVLRDTQNVDVYVIAREK